MALVLVVEDEFLVRMNAVDLIEQAGHEVLEAADADEAIRILESRKDIRIVFSDFQMPGTMDGVRLLQVIHHRWPPIRLILISGRTLSPNSTLPDGSAFLPKPYSFDGLQRVLAAQPKTGGHLSPF